MPNSDFNSAHPSDPGQATEFAIGGNYIQAGQQNPSVVATSGPKGAIFIQAGVGGAAIGLWQKQDDGPSTNWTPAGGGGSGGPATGITYTPTDPADWAAPAPVNAQQALDNLATLVNVANPLDIYVDIAGGSDVTGTGALLRPFQSLEAALAYYTAAANGNYLIHLGSGNYGSAPIAIPVLANKTLGIKGDSAGSTSIGVDITYTALGLSDENFYMTNLSVGPQMVFDFTSGAVVNVTLLDGGYKVKRVDTLPPGPQVIRIFNSTADDFDISGTCIMTGCQFVGGGTNIVQPAGFLVMTGCLFASMVAQIDGTFLMQATLAQGTTLTGAGSVNTDSSSAANLIVTGPTVNYIDNAATIAYAPAVPSNWTVIPTQVNQGIDILSARTLDAPEQITLTPTDITAKQVTLSNTPLNPAQVQVEIYQGVEQRNGIDFTVTGNILSWSGLGMDGLVISGDVLIVPYAF